MNFLRKAYPICRESTAHALATADRDKDGYLEGPGLLEQAGMGPERIDSVCYLYAAYQSLAQMGVVHNNILALAAFTYGKADLGWKLMKLSAKAPLEERMLGAFDETMPGGGDLIQLWSFGPFLEALIGGLAGVHPQPNNVDLFPQLPRDLDWCKLEDCRIAEHVLTLEQSKTGKTTTTTITHSKGDAALCGIFWLSADSSAGVTMNGKPVKPMLMPMAPTGIARPSLKYAVPPGQKLIIIVEK